MKHNWNMGSDWLGLLCVILTTLKITVEVLPCKIEGGGDEYSSTSGDAAFLMILMVLYLQLENVGHMDA